MNVVLDEGRIHALVKDPELIKLFPFLLARVVFPTASCSPCSKRSKTKDRPNYELIRQSVAALDPVQAATLKRRINATIITVYHKGPDGKVTSIKL